MTTAELKAIRMQAELTFPTPADRYQIRGVRGDIVMFDLTLERATKDLRHFKGGKIERMAK